MGTKNGQPFHTMEGVIARVTAAAPGNVTTLLATTNWTQLEAALDPTLQTVTDPKGGNIRTAFVGGTARRVLHNIARLNSGLPDHHRGNSVGYANRHDSYASWHVRNHRASAVQCLRAYQPWAKMAVILDLSAFSVAYLRRTSDAAYNAAGAVVSNGIDAEGGTLTTELTCLIKNPAACGIL